MKKTITFLALFCLFIVTIRIVLPKKGMHPYRKSTLTTIQGSVKKSEYNFNRFKKEEGLHLTIKTTSNQYIVHVCPKWYSELKKIKFKDGEKITVLGSTFKKDGKLNIYAASIKFKSGATLEFRDPDNGNGLWRGRKRKERRAKMQRKMRGKH